MKELGLSWKRSLGLFVWYGHLNTTPPAGADDMMMEDEFPPRSIQGAMKAFKEAMHEGRVAVPLAPWCADKNETCTDFLDTLYRILDIYCDHQASLPQLLCPSSSMGSPVVVDYRLSWHIAQLFYPPNDDGVVYETKPNVPVYEDLAPVHMNFVSELEYAGMWHWAVYVALHLPTNASKPQSRELVVKDLLARHCPSMNSDVQSLQQFEQRIAFVHELGVPIEWTHQARALRARHDRFYDSEIDHLIEAREYQEAHRITMTMLFPKLLDPTFSTVLVRLESIQPHVDDTFAQEWEAGGQVIIDYVKVQEDVATDAWQSGHAGASLAELSTKLEYLADALRAWKVTTPKERVLIYDMSFRVFMIRKILATFQTSDAAATDPVLVGVFQQLSSDLASIPVLPENYRLRELNEMCSQYITLRCQQTSLTGPAPMVV
eukprot:GFYU01006426.1.p1 GENE.GFYU01006426.1~~GFYU01006426.1.p1  ORF type:complete len:464 (-),score=131.39 GFYU01006426.1:140-1438(-)